MTTKFSSFTSLALAAVVAFGSFAAASAPATAAATAVTPLPSLYFCRDNPRECRGGGSSRVTMTPNLLAMLKQVNNQVNSAIRPQRDRQDIWAVNPSSGDCEDYALSKRSALIRSGVPASSLRLAITHSRRGVPHAVLVVRTSDGDFVLDNLTNSVKTLQASGYTIRQMSGSSLTQWVTG